MDDDLWSHGRRAGEMGLGDVDGEGEGSWKLPWRNREREKEAAGENVPSRRIQNSHPARGARACDPRGRLLSHVAARTNFHRREAGRDAESSLPCCGRRGLPGHFPGCAVAKSIQLPWSRICLFLSSLPVIVAHKDKQDEENRKRECRQLCVSSCPKQTLKLPLATLVGNVSSRRWARRGEVAAPLQALVAFSNRFLLRAPAHPSWPGLPWFQPPSPAAAAAGGAWQPAHLRGSGRALPRSKSRFSLD